MTAKSETKRGRRSKTRQGPEGTVRKNFNLPQSAIDQAREALGTTTETETVLRALETAAELAAFREATDAALAELVGKGGFVDHFGPSAGES